MDIGLRILFLWASMKEQKKNKIRTWGYFDKWAKSRLILILLLIDGRN